MAPILPPDHTPIPAGIEHVDLTKTGMTLLAGALVTEAVAPGHRTLRYLAKVSPVQLVDEIPFESDESDNVHTEQYERPAPLPAFTVMVNSGTSSGPIGHGNSLDVANDIARHLPTYPTLSFKFDMPLTLTTTSS